MNPKIGNRVILLVCAITLAVDSLFSSWGMVGLKLDKLPAKISGSISGSGGNEPFELGQLGSVFGGLSMSFNGINGNLSAGSIKIPLLLAIASWMAQPLKLSWSFVRQSTLGLMSLALSLYLMWQFAESKWGEWPWSIFGGREAGFNRIELVLYLLLPLSIATLLATFSGKAKVYLFAIVFFTLVLSLV